MIPRRLNVAPEVAQRLPAPQLAQLQAGIDDPDARCGCCGAVIAGPVVEAVLFTNGELIAARLAHPDCARSGVHAAPGLRQGEAVRLADGLGITTCLGRRAWPEPRALVFIELVDTVSLAPPGGDLLASEDPLAVYASGLGLEPVTGALEQITPAATTTVRLQLVEDELRLVHPHGYDVMWDEAGELLAGWRATAREDHATALVITGRGLGLSQPTPPIAHALRTRPAWGAQVAVEP